MFGSAFTLSMRSETGLLAFMTSEYGCSASISVIQATDISANDSCEQ